MRLQPFDRFVYPPPHNSRREHARAWVAGGSAGRQDAADSGDREQSVHSIMNTDSGDHEHLFAPA